MESGKIYLPELAWWMEEGKIYLSGLAWWMERGKILRFSRQTLLWLDQSRCWHTGPQYLHSSEQFISNILSLR
jgi:hypothetical protein